MLKKFLMAPGPTPVPEKVLLEMAKPMIHHRTDEFSKTFAETAGGLKKVFNTKKEVLMLAGSGTAAMEAAIINTLNPGDRVLVINAGKFGQRWRDISKVFGMEVSTLDLDWGLSVQPEQVESFLIANPDTKAVMIQGSETSTTAYHPIKEIGAIIKTKPDTIFIVDGITSIGVHETLMDEWGIDIAVTGSQKAFMLPPGLAFIALSDKAWTFCEKAKIPRYYLDLKRELKNQLQATTAYTPTVSLINGLKVVLDMMFEEGLDHVYKRHQINGDATRAAVKALGFRPLAPDMPSNAATGFYLPDGFEGGKFEKYMREKVGITYAGGQDHLKGKILRISHLGYHDAFDTITAISGLEMGLSNFGLNIEMGAGIRAAQEILKNYIGE